jgi:hypothetical protein
VTLCVYALTGSAARVSAVGVSGERLRVVREGPVAAIVGELSQAPRPSHESLRRYDRTMRALSTRLPALLPARFGSCFDDPDELTFVLRSRRPTLARALAHVRHRAQMTVRVIGTPDPQLETVVAPPETRRRQDLRAAPSAEAGRQRAPSGAAYLRARAEQAAREREVPGFASVRSAVQRWVRDERVEKRARVTTVYHLVPRASADAYRRAIDRATAAIDLQVVVSGPAPAYAFAEGW